MLRSIGKTIRGTVEQVHGNRRTGEKRRPIAAPCSGSTLTTVGRSQQLVRWPGTHSRVVSGIQRAAQTVLGVYLKRTCSRVTSASSALGVLNDYALYKSTHSLTPANAVGKNMTRPNRTFKSINR